jgi:flagellar secretion chaperone FliS
MNPTSAYRETAIRGAGPVRLVVVLYEQMIEDLRQAVNAIKQNQVELRTNKINHAISVIGYLQSSLNKNAGGKVALNLEYFYEQLRANLAKAQFSVSQRILTQQITDLLALREAWGQVERAETAAGQTKSVALKLDAVSSSGPRSFAG